MARLDLVAFLALLAGCAGLIDAQEAAAAPGSAPAADEARAEWERVCAASGDPAREPLKAFQFQADVRTRSGAQVNDARIDIRYLGPDCIRFVLPSRNETGRSGPAPEQYWVKMPDSVVVLAGREYKEDRRKVDDMLALARNYVALSNPARLNILALELLSAPPADLGEPLTKRFRKLRWLAIESPDFALLRDEISRQKQTVYRVELGLNVDHLPAVAIVRERGRPETEPLLVEFSQYQSQDGYELPFQLRAHALDRRQRPPLFQEDAAQEVYVTSASLRPQLTVADFQPRK